MKAFRFSLTFSILSSLAIILGLSWILLSLISFKTAEQDLLAQKNEAMRTLLGGFISILPSNLAALNESSAIDSFTARLGEGQDFAGIVVIDAAASPIYTVKDDLGVDARLRETLQTGAESSMFSDNGLFLMRYAAIRSDGKVVGACRLSQPLAGEFARLKRSRQIFLAYFILDFLLLLGLGSYILSRIVVVPVKRLLTATERVAAGDYSHAVHVPGSAEIGELAESFTQMQEALRVKQEEADSYVRSLEQANADLQTAREESIRSEKMASVGLLAAGMAHEIGTPLSAILGYVGLMRDEVQENRVHVDYLRRMEMEAGRIDRLIRGLLDYARPTSAHYEKVPLDSLVRDTLDLFIDREQYRSTQVSLEMEADLPPVYADRHQLQQVLINLILNARDAMPNGGTLTFSACRSHFHFRTPQAPAGDSGTVIGRRKDDFNKAFSPPATTAESMPCVKLDVRDSGQGIAPEVVARIFDPFFTTKEPGKGTGLGLAICARIVDTFGGRITVATAPGEGTTFSVWLPTTGTET